MDYLCALADIVIIESKDKFPKYCGVRKVDSMVDRGEFSAENEKEVEYYELEGVLEYY